MIAPWFCPVDRIEALLQLERGENRLSIFAFPFVCNRSRSPANLNGIYRLSGYLTHFEHGNAAGDFLAAIQL